MSTAIQQTNMTPQAIVANGYDREKIDLIKNTVARGTSDTELSLFLYTCQRTGLDPLAKQIYAIKRGPTMTIQTGIDGFRVIAERTNKYAPGKETVIREENGKIVSATAYVKKYSGQEWHEVAATAYFDEYRQDSSPMWKKMPRAMISKCAEALALRKAFPADLSGVYATEEMMQADNDASAAAPQAATGIKRTEVKKLEAAPLGSITDVEFEDVPTPAIPSGDIQGVPFDELMSDKPKISEAQRKRIFAMAKERELDINDVRQILSKQFGYEHTSDVTKEDYEKICDFFKKKD